METLSDSVADTYAGGQRGDDCGRVVWAVAFTEEPGHGFDLGPLPRGAGSHPAVRGEFLLHGVPIHAGAGPDAAMDSPTVQLAAQAA